MTSLTVQMFGKLCISWEDETCIAIDSRKALELFCYLLLYPYRPHARENLAETIWVGASTYKSKKYLRQALWQLQSSLVAPTKGEQIPILLVEPNWVQVNPQADLWVDTILLEQAMTDTKGLSGSDLDEAQLRQLKLAVELYRGDFLEGFYDDWCLFERERLQNIYLSLMDKLLECYEDLGQYEDALAIGENILRYEVASERTHRRMARIYYHSGKRTHALRQYERCLVALDQELGVKPAQKTVELYEQIRQDQGIDAGHPILPEFSSVSSFELLAHLEHLQHSVDDFHEKALVEIRSMEAAIRDSVFLKD